MDRELWTSVLTAIKRAAAEVGWHGGRRRPVYANWLIVAMYVWSVWHDRPLSWACRRGSYGAAFRPRKLPSISQFTRRIKSDDCQQILQLVHDPFAQRGVQTRRARENSTGISNAFRGRCWSVVRTSRAHVRFSAHSQ